MEKILKRSNLTVNDIQAFEINEAFAVVPLAIAHLTGIDVSKVNVFGGGCSIGHPLGASGARIVCTLMTTLKHTQGRFGLAGICNGGGGASAILIERVDLNSKL